MYNNGEQAWGDSDLLEEIEGENASLLRPVRPPEPVEILIRDIDVSAYISFGRICVEVTLPKLLKETPTSISVCFGGMEIGVSEEGRAALPSDRAGSPVHREGMA